jgi:hypothetical protein
VDGCELIERQRAGDGRASFEIPTETKHEPVGSLLANYRLAFGSSSLASCLSRSKVIFVSQSGQV